MDKKIKMLLVEDYFFNKPDENIYRILLNSQSSLSSKLQEIFSKYEQKELEKFLVSDKQGLASLLDEFRQKNYAEEFKGESFKDFFTMNNTTHTIYLSTLSQLIFPEEEFKEVVKKHNQDLSVLEDFSKSKKECLENMIQQTKISPEEAKDSMKQIEKMYGEISATIKKHEEEIPSLVKTYFTNVAKEQLKQHLPENIDIDLVSSINEAEVKMQENTYDLIISDLGLPTKTTYEYYGVGAVSTKILNDYRKIWREMDDLIPYSLCPLKQELVAEQIKDEKSDLFKTSPDKKVTKEHISGILVEELAKKYAKNTPFVYFTHRGHGESAIEGMHHLGKISENAKNKLLDFGRGTQNFASEERLYTSFKDDTQKYASVIKDAIKTNLK